MIETRVILNVHLREILRFNFRNYEMNENRPKKTQNGVDYKVFNESGKVKETKQLERIKDNYKKLPGMATNKLEVEEEKINLI